MLLGPHRSQKSASTAHRRLNGRIALRSVTGDYDSQSAGDWEHPQDARSALDPWLVRVARVVALSRSRAGAYVDAEFPAAVAR